MSFQHFLLNSNKENLYPFADLKIINNGKLNEYIKLLDSDITFVGHEHRAFEFDKNGKKIIGVGSSGCTKTENTFYTILSTEKEIINKLFFGINI